VRCYPGILSKTHAEAGQYHTDIKDRFVDNTNDLLHEFIKAIVSFCNRFPSCVAVTDGH